MDMFIRKKVDFVKQWLSSMRYKFYYFMQGRYGSDKLNTHIMYLVIFLFLMQLLVQNDLVLVLAYVLWGISIYRMFSKKIVQRRKENNYYIQLIQPLQLWFNLMRRQLKDSKHRYYRCPKCKQLVRIPKHQGVVTITCPKCYHQFDRRS